MAANTSSLFGSIRNRLLFGTTGLVLIPLIVLAAVLAYFATQQSSASLNARANDQLQSIRVGKEAEIKAYFQNVADSMSVIAQTELVRTALRTLPSALQALPDTLTVSLDQARASVGDYYRTQFGAEYGKRNSGADPGAGEILAKQAPAVIAAQYLYIASNPNPLGEKGRLDRAGDSSEYSTGHALVHGLGRSAVERYGLYDFFLIDMDGNVVYTYFKEIDFATNLRSGPWANSGLGKAYTNGLGLKPGEVLLTDYAPYVPSYQDEATFVSTPVYAGEQQIGVFAVQLPIDRINAIMTFNRQWADVGLGESGEVYLVGADKTPRSISRFLTEDPAGFVSMLRSLPNFDASRADAIAERKSNIGLMAIDTEGANAALQGKTGVGVYPDYRGIPVLGAYAPLSVFNQKWALLSEIDNAEALAPTVALRNQILIAAGLTLLIMAVIAVLIALRLARSINDPLTHFSSVVSRVAQGDNEARVRLAPSDEIGQLAVTFDQMLDERIATQERIERENEVLNNSVVEIMSSVAELAGRDLRIKVPVAEDVTGAVSDAINMMTRSTATALGSVRRISNTVSTASNSVRARSQQVFDVANAASVQATSASEELQQTAMALRQMGDEAQQAMTQADRAIKSTGDALQIVRATVSGISESRDQIRETEKRVKRLGERSQEISSVVTIIGQIAERTSVLALNASMQAVAAGDAGRGFAVVADEVKRLAENARQATQQIASLVNAIQADTAETVQAMNATITQVVDISKLADQAGGQMTDTRAVTEQLAAAVRSIAGSTQAQGEASKKLLTRAYELLQSSQRTLEEIEAQRQDTDTLAESARDLVSTVSEFQLPA